MSPLRFLRQVIAPTGRHRAPAVALVHEPGLPVRSRGVLGEEELLSPWPDASLLAPGAVVAQCFDDCPHCAKTTSGVVHKDGWTCGECLKTTLAGGVA